MTIDDLLKEPPKEEDKPKADDNGYDYSEAWQKAYPTQK